MAMVKAKATNLGIEMPQKVVAYIAENITNNVRELASMSFPEIGKVLDQHHTSVMYGIETLTKSMAKDENLRDSVNDLKKNIQSK